MQVKPKCTRQIAHTHISRALAKDSGRMNEMWAHRIQCGWRFEFRWIDFRCDSACLRYKYQIMCVRLIWICECKKLNTEREWDWWKKRARNGLFWCCILCCSWNYVPNVMIHIINLYSWKPLQAQADSSNFSNEIDQTTPNRQQQQQQQNKHCRIKKKSKWIMWHWLEFACWSAQANNQFYAGCQIYIIH